MQLYEILKELQRMSESLGTPPDKMTITDWNGQNHITVSGKTTAGLKFEFRFSVDKEAANE